MEEKYKIASDESYRDPTNILRKLKKHEAVEQEMKANKKHFMELMVVKPLQSLFQQFLLDSRAKYPIPIVNKHPNVQYTMLNHEISKHLCSWASCGGAGGDVCLFLKEASKTKTEND